jgi:ABC-type branched-subunit amino acid transport system ATPase component
VLEIRNVSKKFGGLDAVSDCTLTVKENSITGLIGPNGAGKTTLFNVIANVYQPTEGEVLFRGEKLSGTTTWKVPARGVARTFQTPHGFPLLTVMESLMATPLNQRGEKILPAFFRGAKVRAEEAASREKAHDLLRSIDMLERRNELVVNLSAGEARLVEMARQLMLDPKLLLLDEPAAGINPALRDNLVDLLRRLRTEGLTILVIDHNLGFIMDLCDYIYVLARGRLIAEGTPAEISQNQTVIEAYVGKSA